MTNDVFQCYLATGIPLQNIHRMARTIPLPQPIHQHDIEAVDVQRQLDGLAQKREMIIRSLGWKYRFLLWLRHKLTY